MSKKSKILPNPIERPVADPGGAEGAMRPPQALYK